MPRIEYRPYRGPEDFPVLLRIVESNDAADGKAARPVLDDIIGFCRPTDRFLPERDLDIACLDDGPGEPLPIGFSKRSWYSGYRGCLLYCQYSCLAGEWRRGGIWPRMVRRNEELLRGLHAARTDGAGREAPMLQAWSADSERDWTAVLEGEGYGLVRSYHNMRRPTKDAPVRALPPGFETRPVEESHLRRIWEAQRDLNLGVFECVEEDWSEERFGQWAEASRGRTGLWQVAWSGEEVAATVLAHYEEGHTGGEGRSRGFTEHIYVRPACRGRGLAVALIANALRALHDLGVEEAELGVDSRNESSAYGLYTKLGYGTESIDSWYRKPL